MSTTIYLYVKIHNKTGLKYLGKTTKKDPYKYKGSGVYWLKHIKKYGYDVTTKILFVSNDIIEFEKVSLQYSYIYNIVDSPEWANLQEENGKDGAPVGHIGCVFTEEQKQLFSENSLKRWSNQQYKDKLKQSQSKSWTPERKMKHIEFMKTFWTEERKKQHASKISGKPQKGRGKGIPKPPGFGEKISKALKGKKKSENHKKALSESKKINRSHKEDIFD